MKNLFSKRILATILTVAMMVSMVLVFTVSGSAEEDGVYTLNAADLNLFSAGAKDDGDYEKAGTNNYFTVFYSQKAKIETNDKSFSDGFAGTQRIAWGDKTTVGSSILNAVKITTRGAATVRLWWVGGDVNRYPTIFDQNGSTVTKSNVATVKNDLYVEELQIPSAGTYYIGNTGGSNYFYQIQVTDSGWNLPAPERAAWSTVANPAITNVVTDDAGSINVTVNANVGINGADELLVHLYSGNQLVKTKGSVTEKNEHNIVFKPENSGDYVIKVELRREGEIVKTCDDCTTNFLYPLGTPAISSVTSKGSGKIEIVWGAVHEAEKYEVYQDGTKIGDTTSTSYTASGLTIGTKYSFHVVAIRGDESTTSKTRSAVATEAAQRTWGFTTYGPSTSDSKNGYRGEVNEDGKVTVYSTGNAGKIQPASIDGLAFYYTAIPTSQNFTLRAKISVDEWTLTNGQEGFGLLVTDRLGVNGDKGDIWNNSYFAGSTKIEYRYNPDTEEVINVSSTELGLTKYTMKLGIGVIEKTGITKDNLAGFESTDGDLKTATINKYFNSVVSTLDYTAMNLTGTGGTYNIIGNYTSDPEGNFEEIFRVTEYIMEIQKNNTGYFIRYYDAEGNLMEELKHYDPDALSQLDSDFVYVGFAAARSCTATFSDIELTTIAPEDDKPAEEPPVTLIVPQLVVNSGTAANNRNYTLILDPNLKGTVNIKYNDRYIYEGIEVEAEVRKRFPISLTNYEENENVIHLEFTPDPNQELPEFHKLSTTGTVRSSVTVILTKGNYHRKTIYVSPTAVIGAPANGTKEFPYDIQTALNNAYPGQTIILMEGTYKLNTALKIQRGMDGTPENPIRMIADPEATTRPVIDFQRLYDGFTHAGNYWYFYGFDVARSKDGQKGFQISGNYNVLDQIHTYENGNTGIQLTRLNGADLKDDWPSYNLILNCTSYRNYDLGFEDADGFAAKLTVGEGNVFDGCIAYNNADDGWDLYAKVGTGAIGAVTIRNCIAYENGFVPGVGSKTGNGNGFKMGGESISGKHVIENSIAFNNLLKGIDSNSCPDIIIKDCISFNNGGSNVALYTNSAASTAFKATGLISFRTDGLDVTENLKGKGAQVSADYNNETTFYWDPTNGCVNTKGQKITADMFVSLVFDGWERNADGSINLKGFLEIKDSVPEAVDNCKLGGMASYDIVLLPDEECSFSRAWYTKNNVAHWHVCTCGNKSEIIPHDFVTIIDIPQEGDKNGQKHDECTVCGYKKAAMTIYPEQAPVDPPVEPGDGDVEEPVQLNFFQRIWQAIINFFRNLFGIKPKE